MPAHYDFKTHWQIRAPLTQVWDAIYNSLEWPHWWKGVIAVQTVSTGDDDGIGGVRSYTWRSVLPYQFSFHIRLSGMEKHKRIQGQAYGDLEGIGEWLFSEDRGITHVQYHWSVVTHKPWMNAFSFFLRPVFQYNHTVSMRWGAQGLSRKLNAELLSC